MDTQRSSELPELKDMLAELGGELRNSFHLIGSRVLWLRQRKGTADMGSVPGSAVGFLCDSGKVTLTSLCLGFSSVKGE